MKKLAIFVSGSAMNTAPYTAYLESDGAVLVPNGYRIQNNTESGL